MEVVTKVNNGENPIIEQFYPKWRNGNPMTTRSTLLMFLWCVFGLESYPKTIKALHGPCNMGTVEKGYRQFIWLFSNSEEFKIHSKFIAIFNLSASFPIFSFQAAFVWSWKNQVLIRFSGNLHRRKGTLSIKLLITLHDNGQPILSFPELVVRFRLFIVSSTSKVRKVLVLWSIK